MGLGNHGTGTTFVNVANGKLHFKENDEKKTADFLEGVITSIGEIEDELDGQKTIKVVVDMADADRTYRLKFTRDAWFSVGFFARIGNIDITKPVKVGVMQSEKNEKVSFCWMKQQGQKIEPSKETPRPVKTTVGKGKSAKEVIDFSDFNDFVEKTMKKINEALTKKSSSGVPKGPNDDDLPF